MRLGPSKTYRLLFLEAAKRAGTKLPDVDSDDDAAVEKACIAAAGSDDALRERSIAWEAYEKRLLDHRTYSLDEIRTWLVEEWHVTIGRSSVDRDRKRVLEPVRVNELANQRLRQALDLVKDLPADEMFAEGTRMSAQMILSAMLNYSVERLEDLKPGQVVTMMDTFARMAKGHAETTLINANAKLKQQQIAQFDAAVKRAQAGSKDGRVSPAQMAEIRKAVIGEDPA